MCNAGIPDCAVQSCTAPQQSTKPSSAEFDALLTLHQQQHDCFAKREAMVLSLSDSHALLIAAITPQHHTANWAQVRYVSIECFQCHQLGHIARNCTFPPTRRRLQPSPNAQIQCSLCSGWVHLEQDYECLFEDYECSFELLLTRSGSVCIHVRNLQKLMIEVYNSISHLNPSLVWEFYEKKTCRV